LSCGPFNFSCLFSKILLRCKCSLKETSHCILERNLKALCCNCLKRPRKSYLSCTLQGSISSKRRDY
jgi:hypothetical protein